MRDLVRARETLARGDQIVYLQVVLPEKPDDELRTFLQGWSIRHKYDVRKKSGME